MNLYCYKEHHEIDYLQNLVNLTPRINKEDFICRFSERAGEIICTAGEMIVQFIVLSEI